MKTICNWIFTVTLLTWVALAPAANNSAKQPVDDPTPSLSAQRSSAEPDYLPGVVVVKFRSAADATRMQKAVGEQKFPMPTIDAALRDVNVQRISRAFPEEPIEGSNGGVNLGRIYKVEFDPFVDAAQVANRLAADPAVEYAEPLYIYQTTHVPNDPRFGDQQFLQVIRAAQAWDVLRGDSTVIVGIVDTGVDLDHEDLRASIWYNDLELNGVDGVDDDGNGYVDDFQGWDFIGASFNNVRPDNDPRPYSGSFHGTHVAGLAAAVTDNGVGISSIGYGIRIMVTKHGEDQDSPSLGNTFAGVKYMADNGADVINMSWGGGSYSEYARDILDFAYNKGVVLVTSAGNNDGDTIYSPPQTPPVPYPSGYPTVFSVANTQNDDRFSSGSLWGPWVDVCAPGTQLLSTVKNNFYGYATGTSMSSPLVAGLAALVKQQHPDWTPDQIMSQIRYTADDILSVGQNRRYAEAGGIGSGRVNAYRALSEAPGSAVQIVSLLASDAVLGNNNARIEPGEGVEIEFSLTNVWGDLPGVSVSLSSNDYAIQLANSSVTIGDFAGGDKVISAPQSLTLNIDAAALPHYADIVFEVSAANGYSLADTLRLAVSPLILLVDDDDGNNNVESYYRSALDSLGFIYEVWDRLQQGPVGAGLSTYPVVIWLCEWAFPSLDADDREDIAAYLDAGGNLFLSGQDVGWDLADLTSDLNEFYDSFGLSLVFFEDYLHSRYLVDDSDHSSVTGVAGDPIGDGLEFTLFQPGRSADNQYPDELDPFKGGEAIFTYANGKSGAVRYDGDYRVVYFGFGGYEAITDADARFEVMRRIMAWFSGLGLQVDRLGDTEEIAGGFVVDAQVAVTGKQLEHVDLYWDTDGQLPYNRIPMVAQGGGLYRATIPAQNEAQVNYFVFAQTADGFYAPLSINSFYAGTDTQAPKIDSITAVPTQLSNAGPFRVSIKASDNIGMDTDWAFVYYSSALWPADSSQLTFSDGVFQGEIPLQMVFGDTVTYFLRVRDRSSQRNVSESGPMMFTAGLEDFEQGLVFWQSSDTSGWTLDAQASSGEKAMRWNPQFHRPGGETTIQIAAPLDMRGISQAALAFKFFHITRATDSVRLEISVDDGENWIAIGPVYSGVKIKSSTDRYLSEEISLNDYIGAERLWLRFKYDLSEGLPPALNGFYVDDLQILPTSTGVSPSLVESMPQRYSLAQNFPNPFNMETVLSFDLAASGRTRLVIYNMRGQIVRTLLDGERAAGSYKLQWNGRDDIGKAVSTGVYLYRLESGDFQQTRKLLLLK